MAIKRFRMIAGPNGSGKSTLVTRLAGEYRVNFYSFLNADDILTQLRRVGAYSPKFPIDKTRSRYSRSIAQLKAAIPYLSRAFVFDNSGTEMQFLGEYSEDSGWMFAKPLEMLPGWFKKAI